MTLAQLIAQFRVEVADVATPPLFTDAQVTLWLNEAEEEAAIRARLLRDKVTTALCQISVVPTVSVYALDPRVVEIIYAGMIYASNVGMFPYRLAITTADVLDQVRPAWRSLRYRPQGIIQYDAKMEVDCIPDANYTINLEVYRMPLVQMALTTDSPEISAIHHRHLVKWAKHRAYDKQDADTQDLAKSDKYRKEFEDKFGKPLDASYRKRANANTPHRNRSY